MLRGSRLPAVLAGLTLSTSLAQSDSKQPAPQAAPPLMMASDLRCDAVRDLMVDTVVHQTVAGGYGYGYYGGHHGHLGRIEVTGDVRNVPVPTQAPAVDTGSSGRSGGGGGGHVPPPSHHTTTNVQERGVDEADIVKTDGRHVYTVHNNELVIAKTWPVAKTDVAARVQFATIYPQQLYLRGDEVVIQGAPTQPLAGFNHGHTRVIVVDVKQRQRPSIKRIIDVEGGTLSSRVVGDDLYLVQNTWVQPPQKLYTLAQQTIAKIPRAEQYTLRPWEVQSRLAATLRRTLVAGLTQADVEGALPKLRAGTTTRRMACGDLYIPPSTMNLGVTSLARVSLADERTDLVGAFVTGGTVYASTDALYLASPHYAYNQQGYADYSTQVHKFALGTRQTRPAYLASGKVAGMVLNQFSMSEHKGDLRIATTDWNWGGQQGGNNLYVMRSYGRELRSIGALTGLAKGERIYSGRMMGDKGYLVTFRQTDPLFTLDLSDPFRPRVVGELKINGFSSYIHPMGGDLLLTIGQDATDQGRVTGLHLQVFDVSNPARPTRKFHEKLAPDGTWSSSTAQYDHHAFMYDPVTGTLAFPITMSGKEYFNGLAVYSVDRKRGFRAKGWLSHKELSDVAWQRQCATMKQQNPQYAQTYCNDTYRNQYRANYPITRSMIVDKYILSLSQAGLEIHELGDLDTAATLSWFKVQEKTAIIAR